MIPRTAPGCWERALDFLCSSPQNHTVSQLVAVRCQHVFFWKSNTDNSNTSYNLVWSIVYMIWTTIHCLWQVSAAYVIAVSDRLKKTPEEDSASRKKMKNSDFNTGNWVCSLCSLHWFVCFLSWQLSEETPYIQATFSGPHLRGHGRGKSNQSKTGASTPGGKDGFWLQQLPCEEIYPWKSLWNPQRGSVAKKRVSEMKNGCHLCI